MPRKQYLVRLDEKEAKKFDALCENYNWSPSVAMTKLVNFLDKVQRIPRTFKTGYDQEGGAHLLGQSIDTLGEFEFVEDQDAVEVLAWILEELRKGIHSGFTAYSDEFQAQVDYFSFFEGDYPSDFVGSIMMSVDGLSAKSKPEKESDQ